MSVWEHYSRGTEDAEDLREVCPKGAQRRSERKTSSWLDWLPTKASVIYWYIITCKIIVRNCVIPRLIADQGKRALSALQFTHSQEDKWIHVFSYTLIWNIYHKCFSHLWKIRLHLLTIWLKVALVQTWTKFVNSILWIVNWLVTELIFWNINLLKNYIFLIQCEKARAILYPHQLPTRGDNIVSVAQGSTATPGATEQLLPPDRVLNYIYKQISIKKNIFPHNLVHTRSTQ